MSVILQNAVAFFDQSTDGKYHLVVKGELLGHSELQDRLIRHLFSVEGVRTYASIKPAAPGSQSAFALSIVASEQEIADIIVAEDANRKVQQVVLDRSYTDVAADAVQEVAVEPEVATDAVEPEKGDDNGAAQVQSEVTPAEVQEGGKS